MTAWRSVKRRLGGIRDKVLYQRGYARLATRAAGLRTSWIDAAIDDIPALPPAPDAPDIEVHCTAGEAHSAMGLWAGWSVMRFLPQARFVLHDDGSLSDHTRARWTRLIPGLRVVTRRDATVAMASMLAAAPRVIDWTARYHFGNKLGAVQAMATTARIIELDADVLMFDRPEALISAAEDRTCTMTWNRDIRYAYAYPEPLLQEVLAGLIGPLPDRLNSGLTMLACFDAGEWQLLDAAIGRLENDPRTDPMRYWMQQTLHALVASNRGEAARPLPAAYDVCEGATRPGSVARHFVGNPGIRPLLFIEGIPNVIRNGRLKGHLPEDFAAAHVAPDGALIQR